MTEIVRVFGLGGNTFVCSSLLTSVQEWPAYKITCNGAKIWVATLDLPSGYVSEICSLIQLMDALYKRPPDLKVAFISAQQKKKFGNIITHCGINSGETDLNQKTVLVYRQQEWRKVLLHELIHFYRVDQGWQDELWTRSSEAGVEWLAEMIYSVIVTRTEKEWLQLYNLQNKFAYWQAAQLLLKGQDSFSPKTSVYSYYIAKSWLWHFSPLVFRDMNAALEKFSTAKDDEWYRQINARMKWMKDNKTKLDSARMFIK